MIVLVVVWVGCWVWERKGGGVAVEEAVGWAARITPLRVAVRSLSHSKALSDKVTENLPLRGLKQLLFVKLG